MSCRGLSKRRRSPSSVSEHHGCLGFEAAEAGDPIHHRLVPRREGEGFDAAVELVAALQLVLEESKILGEHEAVLLGQRPRSKHLTDPVQVPGGPVSAFAVDEASPA